MANNDMNSTRELVVVYDWQRVINIWTQYQKGKISMSERDQALAHGRTKLQDEMIKSSQKFGRIHNSGSERI